jgi:hypothetical protein
MSLAEDVSGYAEWRARLTQVLTRLEDWLEAHELSDGRIAARLARTRERLRDDRLVVAFLAEFSRGKSELINAIFFAGSGARVLPSSAGRTTMCPTELMWSPDRSPAIELLPIETRAEQATIADLKLQPEIWERVELDPSRIEAMQAAIGRVSERNRVPADAARRLGFAIAGEDADETDGLVAGADGLVEIPRWRHAAINFPHPLLEDGLVILDTPGLNAIGAEPELTLSLLPTAHAVLFILAADTGVTQSDLAVWREHVQPAHGSLAGRLVALNKIDGLWDGLRSDADIDAEVARQVDSCASILQLPASRIFPISAQKGLAAKINGDAALLARSRLGQLETALAGEIIPAKRHIVGEAVAFEAGDVTRQVRGLLEARLAGVREQLDELRLLRGKNQNVVEYIIRKVKSEKGEFERSLQRYYATRSVFSDLTNKLFSHLGMERVREDTRTTREAMTAARFSAGLRDAMTHFFEATRGTLRAADGDVAEIMHMMEAMHKRFQVEHGLQLGTPMPFSLSRYTREIDRLEEAFRSQVGNLRTLLTTNKQTLTQKFFESIAIHVRRTFEVANRDVEQWLRALMAPLETQVREHQLQLKRRLESMKRIHEATDTLQERIRELEQIDAQTSRELKQLKGLEEEMAAVSAAMEEPAALAA